MEMSNEKEPKSKERRGADEEEGRECDLGSNLAHDGHQANCGYNETKMIRIASQACRLHTCFPALAAGQMIVPDAGRVATFCNRET